MNKKDKTLSFALESHHIDQLDKIIEYLRKENLLLFANRIDAIEYAIEYTTMDIDKELIDNE